MPTSPARGAQLVPSQGRSSSWPGHAASPLCSLTPWPLCSTSQPWVRTGGCKHGSPRLGNTCHGAPCHLNWGQGGRSWGALPTLQVPTAGSQGCVQGLEHPRGCRPAAPCSDPSPPLPVPRLPSPGKEKSRSCAYKLFRVSLCLFYH